MDIEAEHVRGAVKGVPPVELPVLGQCLLGADREDAELRQPRGEHPHRRPMGVEELRLAPGRTSAMAASWARNTSS